MQNKMILMAVAAFTPATGSVANARLHWNMSDCEATWGKPIKVEYVELVSLPSYLFKAQSNLFVRVFFLNGEVNNVVYLSPSKSFLVNNASQLMAKNSEGEWTVYDDGRGKLTSKTWNVLNPDGGDPIAYAILYSKTDNHGFYCLQVSTGLWSAYVDHRGIDVNNQQAALNI